SRGGALPLGRLGVSLEHGTHQELREEAPTDFPPRIRWRSELRRSPQLASRERTHRGGSGRNGLSLSIHLREQRWPLRRKDLRDDVGRNAPLDLARLSNGLALLRSDPEGRFDLFEDRQLLA